MKKKRRATPENGMTVRMLKKELAKVRRGLTAVAGDLGKMRGDMPIIIIGDPPPPSPRVAGADCLKSVWKPGAKVKRIDLARALGGLSLDLGRLARYLATHR
ncbi:MAG: hypothetical protein JW952_08675 [Candidatus Eisenbacteria bacterium]|nr:hypothetical protein [Candidatus Eisenbacteria bacterium]